MSFLWVIGGFLSFVTKMTNFALASYQSFAIDKSMLKKVFSIEEMPENYNRIKQDENLTPESAIADPQVLDL